jgi:hypothetical protein
MSIRFFIFSILALLVSCSGSGSGESIDDIDSPENIYPSNLQIEIEIIGSTTQNPNGDGSGQISVTATATDAIKYNFNFGTGDSFDSSTGHIDYTFTKKLFFYVNIVNVVVIYLTSNTPKWNLFSNLLR